MPIISFRIRGEEYMEYTTLLFELIILDYKSMNELWFATSTTHPKSPMA
jgi:hypothetical protein